MEEIEEEGEKFNSLGLYHFMLRRCVRIYATAKPLKGDRYWPVNDRHTNNSGFCQRKKAARF
jgi:hypothetical protein